MWNEFLDKHALRWALLSPLSFAFGAAFYMTAESEPSVGALIGLSITAWGLVLAAHKAMRSTVAFLVMLMALFPTGATVAMLHAEFREAPRIEQRTSPVSVEGVLLKVEAGANGNRLLVRTSAISDLPKSATPIKVRLTQRNATNLSPGRPIRCLAMLMPPPARSAPGDYNFQRQAWFEQLGAVGFVLGECNAGVTDTTRRGALGAIHDWISALRRAVAQYVADVAGEAGGGMAAAMVSGDRSLMSEQDADALRGSGLAHLLAISGLHMGLAGGVFFFGAQWAWRCIEPLAIRFAAKKVAAITSLTACTLYLALSGAAVATQRAYIMASVALVAILFDRSAISTRSLAIAMFIIVALQPQSVVTPGFQMSFAATAALIAMYEAWPRQSHGARTTLGRLKSGVVSIVATSTMASIATAPFAYFHFGRVAVWSIPANLVVMPVISAWTTPSAALAAVFAPFGASDMFLKSMGASLSFVLQSAHYFNDLSHGESVGKIFGATPMFLTVIGCAVGAVTSGVFRWLSLPVILFAIAMWWLSPTPSLILSSSGEVFVFNGSAWESKGRVAGAPEARGMVPMQLNGAALDAPCDQICQYSQGDWVIELETTSPGTIRSASFTNTRSDRFEQLDFMSAYGRPTPMRVSLSPRTYRVERIKFSTDRPRPWDSPIR